MTPEKHFRHFTCTLLILLQCLPYPQNARVFSSTKKLIAPERNRLTKDIIKVLECLKNWWDRGLVEQLDDDLGRNLYSIHSFLHTILLIVVPTASPVLELLRKDVMPIGYRSSGRVVLMTRPNLLVRTTVPYIAFKHQNAHMVPNTLGSVL